MNIESEIKELIENLEIIFFDFDGVFTNNLVIIDENGKESVVCNRSDGYGLKLLREIGIEFLIISSEVNKVVEKRAIKLNIKCYCGLENKLLKLQEILDEKQISSERAALVGNDINDIECMNYVGLAVAVPDAYPEVINISDLILEKKGGYGAVREFCELIYKIKTNNKEISL